MARSNSTISTFEARAHRAGKHRRNTVRNRASISASIEEIENPEIANLARHFLGD